MTRREPMLQFNTDGSQHPVDAASASKHRAVLSTDAREVSWRSVLNGTESHDERK